MKSTSTSLVFSLAALLLCFSSGSLAAEETISDHPHYYPYTKVLADEYHLRLDVDHNEKKMALIFEDISEKAVRLVTFNTIDGEVILPGGESRKVKLTAVKEESKRTRRDPLVTTFGKRKAGRFEAEADWLRTATDFDLIVTFPFADKDYKFVFEYATSGPYPYHMRR
jgi:hypothetical protein